MVTIHLRATVVLSAVLVLAALASAAEPATRAVEKAAEEAARRASTQAAEGVASNVATQPTTRALEKVAEQAARKAATQAATQAAEKAVEKMTEKAAEKAADKVAEKAAEKAVEKAEEKAVAKEELKSKRPDEWAGRTTVHFFVFDQNFMVNVYLRLRWKDARLASPGSTSRQVPMEDVWNPRVLLANRQGLVSRSLPDVVTVDPDGTVVYHQRYTGKLSQPLKLSSFPMDTHTFTIQFAATGHTVEEIEFVPDVLRRKANSFSAGSMSSELSLPDWKVMKFTAEAGAYDPVEGVGSAGFSFQFEAKRYFAYYLWQVVLPLVLVVVMSWVAFWVDPDNVGVRVAVASSSILTLIAHRFVVANLLPRLPYMTRMDYLTVGSTLLVLLALIAVTWTSYLGAHGRETQAQRIDRWARLGFPVAFGVLLGWFMFA